MSDARHGRPFSLGTPAIYRIVVQGVLEPRLRDRVGGMEITASGGPATRRISTLMGPMRDQAELLGVLNALYQLRLPLLAVEQVERGPVRAREGSLC